jgi:hypothetical protein
MISLGRRRRACKDVFENSKFQHPSSGEAPMVVTRQDGQPLRFGLEVSLDVVSLKFGIHEIVLAG